MDPAVEPDREAFGGGRAFSKHLRCFFCGAVARYLEGEHDRLRVFEAQLFLNDLPTSGTSQPFLSQIAFVVLSNASDMASASLPFR